MSNIYLSLLFGCCSLFFFFFFNDTATTEIYTLSLHDALPICTGDLVRLDEIVGQVLPPAQHPRPRRHIDDRQLRAARVDRKSTRLNSSHSQISYAVFCLKKKRQNLSCTGMMTYTVVHDR